MNKFAPIAILATIGALAVAPIARAAAEPAAAEPAATAPVASAVSVRPGKMLHGPDGYRIAKIYRVTGQGDVQLILDGKMVLAPASSLSEANGKVVTSLTKTELLRAH